MLPPGSAAYCPSGLIGQLDVDLAFCLAVHLIKDQQLSTDAQVVLLHKVRQSLEGFAQEEEMEAEQGGEEPPLVPPPQTNGDESETEEEAAQGQEQARTEEQGAYEEDTAEEVI